MTYTPPLTNLPDEAPIGSSNRELNATASVAGYLSAIARPLRIMLRASQYAQMVRVLKQMPDSTLSEIGISRSDIPDYAKSLFENE
ncbi:MAG: DUF1127 domain-containing protein [Pseudomonadota bacterium]